MYIGYKQKFEYFNRIPELSDKIKEVSGSLCASRYYPDSQTKTIDELLKKPERYFFYFITKSDFSKNYVKHCCYYDDKEKAKQAVEKIKEKYFLDLKV